MTKLWFSVAVLGLVGGCANEGEEPVDPAQAAPNVSVIAAEEVGLLPRSTWVQGRDGGPSALAFGRSVWTFGDTVLNQPAADGSNWHTNSYQLAEPENWKTQLIDAEDSIGAPRYFVELSASEKQWDDLHAAEECALAPCASRWALWPSQPLWDETNERAWVLYGIYNDHGPSGIGVASWNGLDEPVVRHRFHEGDDGWLLFPAPEPEWANAPVVHDGWLYAFACGGAELAWPCRLARVPIDAVTQRAAWRFFDGAGWAEEMTTAATLFEGAPIMSVELAPALGGWLLVYSRPFDHEVFARTALELTGPWSDPIALFDVPGDSPYDACHHQELSEENGSIQYITFSRPNGAGWFGAEHVIWKVSLAVRDGAP